MTKKISFQGELGAYSHLACKNVFADYEAVPCRNFNDALTCVSEGQTDLAMIPVENSAAGRVADIHKLVGNSDLKIYAEHFEKVRHQLIAKPGIDIANLKSVRSHVMGLGQCTKVIDTLGLQAIVMADTAGSAKDLSEGEDKSIAAIASSLSAQIYKLKILQKFKELVRYTIEDLTDLSWDYDRMSTSGQETYDRLARMYAMRYLPNTQRHYSLLLYWLGFFQQVFPVNG